LAYHYGRSDHTDKAVEYLARANEKAYKLSAIEEAAGHFDEGMKLLDTLPDTEENRQHRVSLLAKQAYVFRLLMRLPEYYDLLKRYEPMARGLGNKEVLGPFYTALGLCEYSFGYLDQGAENASQGAQLCEASGNIEAAILAYTQLLHTHVYKGSYGTAFELKKDVLRMLEKRFSPRWHVIQSCGVSHAYSYLGRWHEALEEGQEAMKVAHEYSDDSLISFAAWNISEVHSIRGDADRAVQYGDLSLEKASIPQDKVWAQTMLAWAWSRAGEPRRGGELLAELIPIYRAARYVLGEIWTTVYLGEAYYLAGDYDRANKTLRKGLELAESCGMRLYIGWAHRLLGEIALKTNPIQEETPLARPHFEKSIAVFKEIKAENELARTYTSYGRFQKQQGNIVQAREYLTTALEIFERLETLIEPEKVGKELAELA
jgi:tetratricopeptide (TPR) repeat protein